MESSFDAKYSFLADLGLSNENFGCYRDGTWVGSDEKTPHILGTNIHLATKENYEECIKSMESESKKWMTTPAPVRGDIVRQIGDKLRLYKDQLGSLVSLEVGKIKVEGDGEIQEIIDI